MRSVPPRGSGWVATGSMFASSYSEVDYQRAEPHTLLRPEEMKFHHLIVKRRGMNGMTAAIFFLT